MKEQTSLMTHVLRLALAVSVLASLGAVAQSLGASAGAETKSGDPLVGMWDVTVTGSATYFYTYSISRGAFIATGNVDGNWDGQGSSFGPTMGSYERVARRTFRIHEKAWSFDPQGAHVGHSVFVGTYAVDESGSTLTGDGTWTLYDLAGNAIYVEPLTVTGTKIGA